MIISEILLEKLFPVPSSKAREERNNNKKYLIHKVFLFMSASGYVKSRPPRTCVPKGLIIPVSFSYKV